MRTVIVLLTMIALVPRTVVAQAPRQTFAVGARLRISAPALGDDPRLAQVVASSSDTLVVRPADARDFTVTVPLAEVTRIEVSTGHRPRKKRFALIGLAAGSAVGALVGVASYSDPCASEPAVCAGWFYETQRGDAVAGAFGGGILGAIGGAVLGQVWQRETWTALPFTRTGRVRLTPGGGGLASRDGSTRVGLRISLR